MFVHEQSRQNRYGFGRADFAELLACPRLLEQRAVGLQHGNQRPGFRRCVGGGGGGNKADGEGEEDQSRYQVPEAIAKFGSFVFSHARFPLTPTLSLGEREEQGMRNDISQGVGCFRTPQQFLPKGEGWGEGEHGPQKSRSMSNPIISRLPHFHTTKLHGSRVARRRIRFASSSLTNSSFTGSSVSLRPSCQESCAAKQAMCERRMMSWLQTGLDRDLTRSKKFRPCPAELRPVPANSRRSVFARF